MTGIPASFTIIRRALFVFICGLIVFSGPLSYAFSINISPPSVYLEVPAGGTDTGTITVTNNGELAMDMRAYIQDWVYTPGGAKNFLPPASTPLSCADWINVYPQKFHIEPNEKMGVQYTISVPEDASGGHYAVIFFESIAPLAPSESGLTVSFSGRIGSIIYHKTKGKTSQIGSISSFECGRPDENKPLEIKITLKNEGDTHIIAEGVVNIIDADGNIFGRQPVGPINTLPGDSVEYTTEWLGELEEGSYDVIATLDAGVDFPLIAETTLTVSTGGAIKEFTADSAENPPVFNVIITNEGNLNADLSGRIEIIGASQNVMESVLLKQTLIAPHSERKLEVKPEGALPPGSYTARVTALLGGKELVKEEFFSIR